MARREERQRRIDKRRQVAEAAEHDKENQREAEEGEKMIQEVAAGGVRHVLQQFSKVDVETQSPPIERPQELRLLVVYQPSLHLSAIFQLNLELQARINMVVSSLKETMKALSFILAYHHGHSSTILLHFLPLVAPVYCHHILSFLHLMAFYLL